MLEESRRCKTSRGSMYSSGKCWKLGDSTGNLDSLQMSGYDGLNLILDRAYGCCSGYSYSEMCECTSCPSWHFKTSARLHFCLDVHLGNMHLPKDKDGREEIRNSYELQHFLLRIVYLRRKKSCITFWSLNVCISMIAYTQINLSWNNTKIP